ncbi:MAG: hypothetical protein IJ359_08430 [Erysipelotrichaceae bacterium]|nr:hypothetical protein [Erysipelotrichaceae bacterium]
MDVSNTIKQCEECKAIGEIHFNGGKPISLYNLFSIDNYSFNNPSIKDLEEYFNQYSKKFVTLTTRYEKHLINVNSITHITLK